MLENEKEGMSIWEVIKLKLRFIGVGIVFSLIGGIPLGIMKALKSPGHEILIWGCGAIILPIAILIYLVGHVKNKKLKGFKLQIKGKIGIKAIGLVTASTIGYMLWYGNSIELLLEDVYLLEYMEKAMKETVQEWLQYPFRAFVEIVVIAPICEEILYRGIFLDGLLKRYKASKAIIISAVIFGVAHLNIPQGVNALLIGIVLGIIYYKTKSLILCMIVHFTNNLVAYMYIFDKVPEFSQVYSFIVGIILFIGVAFYAFKHKESLTYKEIHTN